MCHISLAFIIFDGGVKKCYNHYNMKKAIIISIISYILFLTGVGVSVYFLGECNHNLTLVEYQAETCTENGNVEYWECSVCHKTYSEEAAENEIEETIIPAAGHKSNDLTYDYDEKEYGGKCSVCNENFKNVAGDEDFPLLARDETELKSVVDAAEEGAFIKLANDIVATAGQYKYILRLPENGTLDLGGYTVTVKHNGGFLVEGTNVILQNGKIVTDFPDPKEGYALFLGDMGEDNVITVKNLETKGGLNVYNCKATLYNCKIDSSAHKFYALWADSHSTITVESGEYWGGQIACVHSTTNIETDGCGYIVINGGTFHGIIKATYCTTINGGQFDDEVLLEVMKDIHAKLIVNKDYKTELKIGVVSGTKYEIVSTVDENGNFVYETKLKEENND